MSEVPSETPAFHKNQFTFWVHGGLSAEHNLTLGAFVVMEEGKEPQALGNCTLSLGFARRALDRPGGEPGRLQPHVHASQGRG